MPIYEYQCASCNYHFEKLQSVSETSLRDCPHCHQPQLQKIISRTSFKLTGTGWYETDFKHKDKAESNKTNNSQNKKDDNRQTETTSKKTDSTTTATRAAE